MFPEVLSPEGNIVTEGNILSNPPSGSSINRILCRQLKASKLKIKNLTHCFVNPLFYFQINASIVAFHSNHISFGILMTTFSKFASKFWKSPQVLRLKFNYSSLINTIYILKVALLCCHARCVAWSTCIMFTGNMVGNIVKRNAGSLNNDVRSDIAIYYIHDKLLQSDWSRGVQLFHWLHSPGVQLMIFVMAGGTGNQNNKNTTLRRNLSNCIYTIND
jgi:hypothetical protein